MKEGFGGGETGEVLVEGGEEAEEAVDPRPALPRGHYRPQARLCRLPCARWWMGWGGGTACWVWASGRWDRRSRGGRAGSHAAGHCSAAGPPGSCAGHLGGSPRTRSGRSPAAARATPPFAGYNINTSRIILVRKCKRTNQPNGALDGLVHLGEDPVHLPHRHVAGHLTRVQFALVIKRRDRGENFECKCAREEASLTVTS